MIDPLNRMPDGLLEQLRENRDRVFWLGIILCAIGALMIVFPVIGSIVTKVMIGWAVLLAGAAMLWQAFQARRWNAALWAGLVAVLHLALGVYLAFFPLTGLVGLTVLMAVLFAIQGVIELRMGLTHREAPGWVWMVLSGGASLVLSLLLVLGLPGTAMWALGLLLGLNFLTSGIGFAALSRSV
ncbi:HdeD family acid-resistance protein [Salibaculum sp.]|uniref:HdeD family acid-resistance protein n=1 Tax=Salibaculum sp. TaxID=2855480 RepID=UPI002B49DE7C|nr:DUF308 domain-containing protein [Salibaculum sp.]HKL68201.1 DUF308 domain-containing protein [Salibaculum sp.]